MCIVHSYPSGYAPYTERYPNFWNQGIINPLLSKLEEVYTRYLSALEKGELDIVQDEWIVKRRNCAATLNYMGRGNQSHISSTFHNESHYMISVT